MVDFFINPGDFVTPLTILERLYTNVGIKKIICWVKYGLWSVTNPGLFDKFLKTYSLYAFLSGALDARKYERASS